MRLISALCILFILQLASPVYSQEQKIPVRYLNAQQIVDMAKSSSKPYLWVSLYVPKCANASNLFSDRVAYYHKKKDKVDLILLSILHSRDNTDSVIKFSRLMDFQTPFYVMDTMYTKGNIRETPMKFMQDLDKIAGENYEFSQHVLIDKKGKIVYRAGGDMNMSELDKYLE